LFFLIKKKKNMEPWLIAVIVISIVLVLAAILIPVLILYLPSSTVVTPAQVCVIGDFNLNSTTEGTRINFGSVAKFTDSSLFILDSGSFSENQGAILYKYEANPTLNLDNVSETQFSTLVSNVSNAFVSYSKNSMNAEESLFAIGLPLADYINSSNTFTNKGLVITISDAGLGSTLEIQAPVANNFLGFGSGVLILDSNTICVGQSYYNDARTTAAVYVVKKENSLWSNFYKVFEPENNSTFFGSSMTKSNNNVLVIGPDNIAIYDDFVLTQTIKSAENSDSKAAYGASLALTEDSLTLLISNSLANFTSQIIFAGAVEIWTRSTIGSEFTLNQVLYSPNPVSNENFGQSISLTNDRLFIGAKNNLFVYVGSSNWLYTTNIQGPSNDSNFAINTEAKKRTDSEDLIICSPGPDTGNGSFLYFNANCI
jgi:hypothetical protein